MTSRQRGGLYLAYTKEKTATGLDDALALARGEDHFTARERIVFMAEFARARTDAEQLKKMAAGALTTPAELAPE